MKKRLVPIILLLAFVLLGCNQVVPGSILKDTLPWSKEGEWCSEKATYRFMRYVGSDEVPDPKLITTEQSELTYTLTEKKTLNLSGYLAPVLSNDSAQNYSVLEMQLEVHYADVSYLPAIHRAFINEPETIISKTVFGRWDMLPRFTYREVLVHQAVGDNLSHIMFADYTGEFLGEKKAIFLDPKTMTPTKTLPIGIQEYDNESLLYVVRALKSLTAGGSATFDFALPYEDYVQGNSKVTKRSITQSTASKLKTFEVGTGLNQLDEGLYNMYYSTTGLTEEERAALTFDCLETTLGLNTSKSGPALKLYFASEPIKRTGSIGYKANYAASNLLIKGRTEIFGQENQLEYTQVYFLKDYENKNYII